MSCDQIILLEFVMDLTSDKNIVSFLTNTWKQSLRVMRKEVYIFKTCYLMSLKSLFTFLQ
jgi:hypothetical protein